MVEPRRVGDALSDPLCCPLCEAELPEDAEACPRCGLSMRAPQLHHVWRVSTEAAELLRHRDRLLQQAREWSMRHGEVVVLPDAAKGGDEGASPPPESTPPDLVLAAAASGTAHTEVELPSRPRRPPPQRGGGTGPSGYGPPANLYPPEPEGEDEFDRRSDEDAPIGPNRPDIATLSVRTTLLGLGVVLLTVAAVIFAAVALGHFGDAGRATALLCISAASGLAIGIAVERSLPATAEALSALTLALLLLDAFVLRPDGAGPSPERSLYWAVTCLVLAGIAVIGARFVRVVPRLAVGVLAQLPLPLLAGRIGSTTLLVLLLGLQAMVLVVLEARWGALVRSAGEQVSLGLRVVTGGGAVVAMLYATTRALGVSLGFVGEPRISGSLTLIGLALVPWTVAHQHSDRDGVRHAGSGAATALVLLGVATSLPILGVGRTWVPVALAAMALIVTSIARGLPPAVRPGPLAATSVFASCSLIAVALPLLTLDLSPLAWWVRPWTVSPWALAADVVSPAVQNSDGLLRLWGQDSLAAPVMLAGGLVALTFGVLARSLHPPAPDDPTVPHATSILDQRYAGSVADLVGAATLLAVPTALSLPLLAAVSLQLLLAGVLLLRPGALTRQLSTSSRFTAGVGVLVLVIALSWSVASRETTLVTGALAVGLLALGAVRSPARERPAFAAAAVLAACAEVAAVSYAIDAPRAWGAGAAAVLAVLLAVVASWWRTQIRRGAEVGGALGFAVSLLAIAAVGPTGVVAAIGAIGAAVVARRPDRRQAAAVSGGLACLAAALLAYAWGASAGDTSLAVTITGCLVALCGTYLLPVRSEAGEDPDAHDTPESADVAEDTRGAARATETVGIVAYLTALLIRVQYWDAAEMSSLLALGATAAALIAIRRERRGFWRPSLTLYTLALWALLAAADVGVPEAYSVAPALALIVVGMIRRHTEPHIDSWRAYGLGLVLGFLPSLVAGLDDAHPVRPLLFGAAALAATLVGARQRLQAPLAVGAAVLTITALTQVAPYTGVLPRWVTVAGVGILLFGIGATYDRRVRDLRRLQERFGRLK